MNFYEELDKRDLLRLLKKEPYETPTFVGWTKVREFLLDVVQNGRSVYFEGDYDVDGLMCTLVCKKCLEDLGVQDFYIYEYRKRTHNVDSVAVQQCLQGHYDYFIVADSGSSDLGLLQLLTKNGIKVIVLDHHETSLGYDDYGDDIAIINTTIENKYGHTFEMSAGALCFTVFDLLYKELGKQIPASFSAFGAVSLLSDIMDMSNDFNRQIYNKAMDLEEPEIPREVLYFKNPYSRFNARYISYWFSPRVNACFRAESFEVLNELFIRNNDAAIKSKCIQAIERIYTNSRKLVVSVSDILDAYTIQLEHFVFADLAKVNKYFNIRSNKLYNYTGYIANNLAGRYGKTGIVVCDVDNFIKGSLRDQFGLQYLPVFQQLCYAAGHGAAFGMRIPKLDFESFMEDLLRVDKRYSIQSVGNEPIVIDADNGNPDIELINDMALYNEFNGPGVPVAILRKQFVGNIIERHSNYCYKYGWGELEIQSNYKVNFGKTVLIKPFYSGKLKLLVQ